MTSSAILLLSALSSLAAEPQSVARPDRLVTISVAADAVQGISAQTIEIGADAAVRNRTPADLENREWTAIRVQGERTETITSESCPQVRAVALSFAHLPPLPISPMAAYVGENLPIGPMMKDGYSTSLAFDTLAPDFGIVTVQLDGWGPYHQWGHEAVSELRSCWPT